MKATIVYAPFQIAELSSWHTQFIVDLFVHGPVVIALPVSKITPSKNSPLSFQQRKNMIVENLNEHSKNVDIVPVPQKKDTKEQFKSLLTAVESLFSLPLTYAVVMLDESMAYSLKDFAPKNWEIKPVDFLNREELLRKKLVRDVILPSNPNVAFRQGVISGLNTQYPINWPTVDFAIRKFETLESGEVIAKFLFGKKSGENEWRFPGGFKDRNDNSLEETVLREASEEVLIPNVMPNAVFSHPKFIISRNVSDWRYCNEKDGIITSLFLMDFLNEDSVIKAGDDLAEVKWFELKELTSVSIVSEHLFLLDALKDYVYSEGMKFLL